MASAKKRQEEQAAELVADDDDFDDMDMDNGDDSDVMAGDLACGNSAATQLIAGQVPPSVSGMFCRHNSDIFGSFTVVQ